jgi:hypothetical protein
LIPHLAVGQIIVNNVDNRQLSLAQGEEH